MTVNKEAVLIVDNVASRKNTLVTKLRMIGFQAEAVSSGFHAINLIENSTSAGKRYCAVIITPNNEDMSGEEVLMLSRNINASKTSLPIFFMSTDRDPENILEVIKMGANDYLFEDASSQDIFLKFSKYLPSLQQKKEKKSDSTKNPK